MMLICGWSNATDCSDMKTRNFAHYYSRSDDMHGIEKFVYTYAVLLAVFLVFAGVSTVSAQAPVWEDCSGPQFGGGGCIPGWVYPVAPPVDSATSVAPDVLCIGQDCAPVSYRIDGHFVIAESALPNGYPVMGFAGPFFGSVEGSPGIWENAFQRLVVEARTANRAQRFIE